MSRHTVTRLAWSIWALSVALVALKLFLQSLNDPSLFLGNLFNALVLLAFATVGALVVSRRPENPIGWIVNGGTLPWALGDFALEGAVYTLITVPGSLPGGAWMAWLGFWVRGLGWVMVTFLLLLFPTGQLPSARWRFAAWLPVGYLALFTVVSLLGPSSLEMRLASVRNPLGIEIPGGIFDFLAGLMLFGTVGTMAVGATAVIVRFGRAQEEERQQLKWLAYGAAFGTITIGVTVVASLYDFNLGSVPFYLAVAGFPVAIGIAILRYRLWDIDLLINRTLVYGTLTASIIGLYVLGVGALSRLLQTQSNLAVSILALLMVAALVRPLRRGLQRGVNRLMRVERSQPADSSAALKSPETELSQSGEATIHTPERPEHASNTTLRGRWLVIARAVWIAIAVVTLALFVTSIPPVFSELRTVSFGEGTSIWQLRPNEARALEQLGLSVGVYAIYWIVIQVVFVLGFAVVAGVIFWRKSDDWLALFVSLFLLMFGANTVTAVPVPPTTPATGYLAYKIIQNLVFISAPLFFFLFPDGQFVPRWTRPLAAGWIVFGLIKEWLLISAPLGDLMVLGLLGLGALAQIYRYRRVSDAIQRQQTKWVVFGFALTFLVFTGVQLLFAIIPWLRQPGATLYRLPALTVILLSLLILPLTIGIAILRYRLWDIDVLINRTLVYAALSASVVGLYVLVVGFLGELFRTSGNLAISVLATGLVALLFQPLRSRLQHGVNRLMYGERDDPYAVLSRLGQRLEATLAPEAILPTIVATVKESLKLPYAAIALKHADADEFAVAAASGIPVDDVLRLPLVYQNETVGQLLLAPRAPGEAFSIADKRLLDDLAHQAGVAVHAVRLTTDLQRLAADLQRSRESLVTTREEERRRLRRDLHDGLGPTLASLAQRLDTARILVPRDPEAAVALLGDLQAQVKSTITDIRRLVYALRPPALDELGLVSAIREHAAHYNESNSLRVSLEAPEPVPPLSAAVEVAAYRIVLEALTNVARHAHAQTCRIRLLLADGLCLEITDDGDGLPTDCRTGVGLTAMRERAVELGGECRIESGPMRGTRVWARLPLPPSEK